MEGRFNLASVTVSHSATLLARYLSATHPCL
jgi:hypothetical protein